MSSGNFLPVYEQDETQAGRRNTLQCLKRGKAVSATPEERVRQRILSWLLNEKHWPVHRIKVERSYDWVGDPSRQRVRSDIELLDDDGKTLIVVECKAPGIPLGGAVERQALEYAIKSNSDYIWVSNGDGHKFLARSSRGKWSATTSLEPLRTNYAPSAVHFDFPDPSDPVALDRYFETTFPEEAYTDLGLEDKRIVLSMHKLLFGTQEKCTEDKGLPFSFNGVHVLEDRGADFHEFGNAGGGKWRGLYGDYIAATSGRVEAMSVAVSTWGGQGGGIRLCVGVRKPGRNHHALQMNMKDCEWFEDRGCWEVYHDGRMAGVSNKTVFDAVEESGAGDWLENQRGYEGYLYLGDLAEKASWENSKELLANVLHYGIIRTNLRDAVRVRRR